MKPPACPKLRPPVRLFSRREIHFPVPMSSDALHAATVFVSVLSAIAFLTCLVVITP